MLNNQIDAVAINKHLTNNALKCDFLGLPKIELDETRSEILKSIISTSRLQNDDIENSLKAFFSSKFDGLFGDALAEVVDSKEIGFLEKYAIAVIFSLCELSSTSSVKRAVQLLNDSKVSEFGIEKFYELEADFESAALFEFVLFAIIDLSNKGSAISMLYFELIALQLYTLPVGSGDCRESLVNDGLLVALRR